jgi:hypothetical protein
LETRIIPKRTEHRIELEQRASELRRNKEGAIIRRFSRHQGRNPLNEIMRAAKAGTLRAATKTKAPFLLAALYPTVYA